MLFCYLQIIKCSLYRGSLEVMNNEGKTIAELHGAINDTE